VVSFVYRWRNWSRCLRAIKWGLAKVSPVTHRDLPKLKKRAGLALLPSEQETLFHTDLGPWCLQTFLEMCAATGCRRGEVMALRWSDIRDNNAFVDRSLCQTKDGLIFKDTKTEVPRKIALPPNAERPGRPLAGSIPVSATIYLIDLFEFMSFG
jgi:integrase